MANGINRNDPINAGNATDAANTVPKSAKISAILSNFESENFMYHNHTLNRDILSIICMPTGDFLFN